MMELYFGKLKKKRIKRNLKNPFFSRENSLRFFGPENVRQKVFNFIEKSPEKIFKKKLNLL